MGRSGSNSRSRSGSGRWNFRGRNRGGGDNYFLPRKPKTKELDSDRAVSMLTHGTDSIFAIFRENVQIACLEKYGNLAKFMERGNYYVPDQIIKSEHYLTDGKDEDGTVDADLIEGYKITYITAIKGRQLEIKKIKSQRANIYAYITSKLSNGSDDEVKRHSEYLILARTSIRLPCGKQLRRSI